MLCRGTLFIHSVCISLHLRERDGESLRHFSKNMFKYLIHFPVLEDTICFLFFCHLTMYLGDIYKLKHSPLLFLCFVKKYKFCSERNIDFITLEH